MITPYFENIKYNTRRFLWTVDLVYLNEISDSESFYLDFMDEIVDVYDENYQSKVRRLKKWELGLATLLVLVLLIEMFLVFLPLIKMLQIVVKDLLDSERSANDLASHLNYANDVLDLKNKEIRDTNIALDKAVILIRINPDGVITYANNKYCKLTKYSSSKLIGKSLFYNNTTDIDSVIYHHIRNEDKREEVWQGEVHDTASDESDFWLDVTIFPVINKDNVLYEYLVVCTNITKRKLAELELLEIYEQRFLKQEEEQKIKSKSIIEGQEVERKRMAIEVHDGLGQMLTALKFTCEAVEPTSDRQQEILGNMKQLLQDVMIETRRISSDLLPTVLNDFGLVSGIKEMLTNVTRLTETSIVLKDESNLTSRLSNEKEIAVYRIVQEAINNSMKHSEASETVVKLFSDAEFLYVSISDDGVGMESQKGIGGNKSGNGLRNMRERARLVDGNIYINSSMKKGTQVFLEIPID